MTLFSYSVDAKSPNPLSGWVIFRLPADVLALGYWVVSWLSRVNTSVEAYVELLVTSVSEDIVAEFVLPVVTLFTTVASVALVAALVVVVVVIWVVVSMGSSVECRSVFVELFRVSLNIVIVDCVTLSLGTVFSGISTLDSSNEVFVKVEKVEPDVE